MLPLIRASLVLVQAISNHRAFLPPNQTPVKGRYHTNEPYVFQIAPLVFKLHGLLLWSITSMEILYAINYYLGPALFPSLSAHVDATICPANRPHTVTPLFATGVLLTVVGMLIRLRCFRELGQFFTFDLSILPGHRLVTSGSYSYVRHPSYTGSILIVMGIAFAQLTAGSLAVECSILGHIGSGFLWTVWWSWTLSVGVSRAIAEDGELQKLFGTEWDVYASTTKYWFVPGLC